MAVPAFADLRGKLREEIRDDFSLQWTDTALDEIINEAQREWALFTGSLVGKIEVTANERGTFAAPVDFYEPLRMTTPDNRDVPIVSWRRLNADHWDFRKRVGDIPEAVCFDFDGYGIFRIFPRIPAGKKIGTIFYHRLPRADVWENGDADAVAAHALYQLFRAENKAQAENHYNDFLNCVTGIARSWQTLRNRKSMRHGAYY